VKLNGISRKDHIVSVLLALVGSMSIPCVTCAAEDEGLVHKPGLECLVYKGPVP